MSHITYHDSYNTFRDENAFFISVLLSDLKKYYNSLCKTLPSDYIAEELIEKLDFYHDLYSNFYTAFVIEAILDFKCALNNYINSHHSTSVSDNLENLLDQVAKQYNTRFKKRKIKLSQPLNHSFITFERDQVKMISYFDLAIKGTQEVAGSIHFLNHHYRIFYPTTDHAPSPYYIVPDRHGKICYPADKILQKIRSTGSDIIKQQTSTKFPAIRDRDIFRYKGARYYPLHHKS